MNNTQLLVCLTATLLAASANADDKWDITKLEMSKLPPSSEQTNVTFARDIQPIFESSCTRCYGEEHQRGKLRLDTLQNALKGGEDGKMIVPGDSKASLLVASIAQVSDEVAMPPKHHPRGHRPPSSDGSGPDNGQFHNGGPPPDGAPGAGGAPSNGGPRGKALTAAQIGLVRAWIDQGAN